MKTMPSSSFRKEIMKEEKVFLDEKRNIVDPDSPNAVMLMTETYDDKGNIVERQWAMRKDALEKLGTSRKK